MADGRRTLADISRAVNNFDRNPSRVIFGGSNNAAAPSRGRAAGSGTERRGHRGRAPSGRSSRRSASSNRVNEFQSGEVFFVIGRDDAIVGLGYGGYNRVERASGPPLGGTVSH